MEKLELTEEQKITLRLFLLVTSRYRKEELNSSIELAKELNEDGSEKFPNMKSNAEWWANANKTIEEIIKLL